MQLFDWLFKISPYLCAIAVLAKVSWNFRTKTDKDIKQLQNVNRPN